MGLIISDLMLRGAALALLLLLVVVLWRDHRHSLPGRLAMVISLGVASYFLLERRSDDHSINLIDGTLFSLEASIFGLFWLFSRSWFNDELRIGRGSWALLIFSVIFSLINWFILNVRDGNRFWPTDIAMRATWIGFGVAGLWTAWQGRKNDLVDARRRLRTRFVWLIGGAALAIIVIFFISGLYMDYFDRYPLTIAVNGGVVLIIYILLLSIVQIEPTDLFAAADFGAPVNAVSDPAADALAMKLSTYMETERAYRDEALTIAGLAASLDEQEYRLRRVINGRLGYRNFSSFLNHYRLREVKEALADPAQVEVSILTIALDSGFGSLAPFNRAFRQQEGMTPTRFRQQQKE